ncbi:MAG: FHA domain-containing protein [Bacteroidota bacterium]|nr:FHA domain-containing protein [Bacteroidota bacterium]MDX5429975.1 FHA domain-containing protein [Bacteroidota bacterium]MDX5468748.1 FHA domain-containing protein [Bacteroidota bacterium]
MANRATQSLTAGMKILGGANLPTYTLEYLTPTSKHKQGAYETIVIPYIELGRSSKCGVQFGEDTPTVSRRHCAIERKGNDTSIINLSQSNPTLVNGKPITDKYFLNNGDEIQLSSEGPKLRYNTTKTGTAKIGFTNKMNLVMQQAIKPYKTAAITILCLFVLAVAGGSYAIANLSQQTEVLTTLTNQQADSLAALNAKNQALSALMKESDEKLKAEQERLMNQNKGLVTEISELRRRNAEVIQANRSGADLIEPLKGYVLALFLNKMTVEYEGETQTYDMGGDCMCTGFITNDGNFVTARHCIDAPLTNNEVANFVDHSGGKVTLHYTAVSYDKSIQFNFTNRELKADYSKDEKFQHVLQGVNGSIRVPDYFSGADWAYMPTKIEGGLPFDKPLSSSLKSGDRLIVLGYSYGMRYRKDGNMEPYYSTANVALSGLQNKTIQTSEAGFDGGNSGGPVFVVREGKIQCIGIVTGKWRKPEVTVTKDGNYTQTMVDANIQIVTPLINY